MENEFNAIAKADIRTRLEDLREQAQQYPFKMSDDEAAQIPLGSLDDDSIPALLEHPFIFYDMACDDIGKSGLMLKASFLYHITHQYPQGDKLVLNLDMEACTKILQAMQKLNVIFPDAKRGLVEFNIKSFELAIMVLEYVEAEHKARTGREGIADLSFDNFMREVTSGQHKYQFDR